MLQLKGIAAAHYSYSKAVIDAHQVMKMTVISSRPPVLHSETIYSVYRGRHIQTVLLKFLIGILTARNSQSVQAGKRGRSAEKWTNIERE